MLFQLNIKFSKASQTTFHQTQHSCFNEPKSSSSCTPKPRSQSAPEQTMPYLLPPKRTGPSDPEATTFLQRTTAHMCTNNGPPYPYFIRRMHTHSEDCRRVMYGAGSSAAIFNANGHFISAINVDRRQFYGVTRVASGHL